MNRDEAKTLMRQELERDIDTATRDEKVFPIGDRLMSANDLMDEVEKETDLGKFLLDDFIKFKAGEGGPLPELTWPSRAHAIALMENDIKIAPPGWADEVIYDEDGMKFTPNQVLDEVKRGTDFGNRFVTIYLGNHTALEALLGKDYDQKLANLLSPYELPPIHKKVKNDKAN